MKLEVLGCSGGKTDNFMLPSFLIGGKILLDCGSVCSALSLEKQFDIEAVFISHPHFDHICDLPFLADNFSIAGKQIKVYGSYKTIELIKKNVFNDEIWPDFTKIPNKKNPVLEFISVDMGDIIKLGDYTVEFFSVFHTAGSIGFIIREGNSVLAYTADTYKENGLWQYLIEKGVNAVITECSFPADRRKLATLSNHLSVPDFLAEYKKMKEIDKIFVFHLKPHYRKIIEKELGELGVIVLKDGDIIEV